MKTVKIIIEKTADGYTAYAHNAAGIYGAGETPEEAKQSILESISLLKELNEPEHIPAILRSHYTLSFQFDAESLLNYYKGIFTNAGLERLTGINQKQLQHYGSGLKKPRENQRRKIESALHKLGSELLSVHL